ncbi:LamG-like jellyroll fold domain-containing protein [Streptomyces capparidis]
MIPRSFRRPGRRGGGPPGALAAPALLATLLATLAASLGAAPPAGASGVPPSATDSAVGHQQALFTAGTGGYGCFRIPALVRTRAGSLLAFAEGRKAPSCGDRGDIDIVVRRSTNDGRTWSPIEVIPAGATAPGTSRPAAAGAPVTRSNPAPVVDLDSGRVHLLTTSNPATASYPRVPWVQHSTDDGLTWSDPVRLEVSPAPGGIGDNWFATGPGHGVQLTEGPHAGRLVVGAHQVQRAGGTYAGYLYLDPAPDGSGTWRAATAVDSDSGSAPAEPSEVAVAESDGGNVHLVARNDAGTRRVSATSVTPSGDAVPSVPAFRDAAIPSAATVQGSLLRLRSRAADGKEHLLLAAPAQTSRSDLTLYSKCGTGAWQSGGKLVSAGRGSYSDLALLQSNEIGLLYEGGPPGGYSADEIRFTRFAESELGNPCGIAPRPAGSVQPSPAPGPTTPDATREANDAYLAGGAALGTGRLSGATDSSLALTGTAYADLPYSRSLRPGAGDVTYSLWFRHTATSATADRVLLWAYGYGADKPQVWLRARPGSDDVYAGVAGTDGAAYVSVPDPSASAAFGDGAWHHVALTRSGARVTVTVDGTRTATGTGVAGPVTDHPALGASGIRLGAKPASSGTEPFTGDLDEFRVYRAALTAAQVTALADPASSGAPLGGAAGPAPVARLPFQVVDGAVAPARTTLAGVDDESGHCTDARLLGPRRDAVASPRGGAFQVDSAHPGLEAPLTEALDLGAGDFTASLWFSYRGGATTDAQALLWAFGMNSAPQLWVQVQPAEDRLAAWVQTDTGSAYLEVPDPTSAAGFGDGDWHQLVLRRQGGQVKLVVDNSAGLTDTAAGLTGSLTAARADGIRGLRVGSRIDGARVLTGAVDEFRLYRRALDQAALDTVHAGGGLGSGQSIDVRYSLDGKYTYALPATRLQPETTPATPDRSARCNHAYVLGGAEVVPGAGPAGGALTLDGGSGGGVLVPRNASLAPESSDFTLTTWFRHQATASSPDRVLVWGYGQGGGARELWLRAQPGGDRLYGSVRTATAEVRITGRDTGASTAFGDGAWHELALVRSGGTLLLYVDAVEVGRAALPPGALTAADTFAAQGLRLGSRPDGGEPLTGALDEVRLFREALTPAELGTLHGGTVPAGRSPVLWLPFDIRTDRSHPRM